MLLLPALAARGGKRRGGLPPHRGEAPDSGARWRIKVAGSGRYLYKENGTAIGSAHFFSLFELRATADGAYYIAEQGGEFLRQNETTRRFEFQPMPKPPKPPPGSTAPGSTAPPLAPTGAPPDSQRFWLRQVAPSTYLFELNAESSSYACSSAADHGGLVVLDRAAASGAATKKSGSWFFGGRRLAAAPPAADGAAGVSSACQFALERLVGAPPPLRARPSHLAHRARAATLPYLTPTLHAQRRQSSARRWRRRAGASSAACAARRSRWARGASCSRRTTTLG